MSEYTPRPRVYLSRPALGLPNYAHLSFCELVYLLPIVDATALYLLVERDTVESHVRADRLHKRAIMFMHLRDDKFTISKTMAHLVRHGAIFSEVSDYGAVLTTAAPLPRDLGLLLHREGLRPRCY